jgi:hypothetical protein
LQSASKGNPKRKNNALRLVYFFSGLGVGLLGIFYLGSLYSQLTAAFSQEEQFVPTRIYSDLSLLKEGVPQSYVESRLKSLGYLYKKGTIQKAEKDTEKMEFLEARETPGFSPGWVPAGQRDGVQTPSRPSVTRAFRPGLIEFLLHPVNYPVFLVPEGHIPAEAIPKSNTDSPAEVHVALRFERQNNKPLLHTLEVNSKPVPDLYLEPELIATLSRSGDVKKEIRSSLKFSEIPAGIWQAIIAIEDQHFLEHKGLSPRGIARAFWVNLKTRSLAQGGSTLTQQLVKNLMARRSKNIFRKFNELFLSLMLELSFDKEQILERYLNEVYLGQVGSLEIHGIAEGAEYFFGKKVTELNLGEIALMAGLIRGPGYYSPYKYRKRAIERQHLVLSKMVETGFDRTGRSQSRNGYADPTGAPSNCSLQSTFFLRLREGRSLKTAERSTKKESPSNGGYHGCWTPDIYDARSVPKRPCPNLIIQGN